MGVPSFFRQNRPKEFRYAPRYYDPVKEEREERLKRIKEEMEMTAGGEEEKRYTGIQRGSFTPKFRQKQNRLERNSSIRFIIILLVLLLLAYIYWRL